jgi:GNAT superfamily N-acetyltransferase
MKNIDGENSSDRCRLAQASTQQEWTIVRALRMKNFFKSNIDPYTWTFDHQDHIHFVFYKNAEIIGYVHIQLWPEKRALLRIIVIDEPYRNLGFGGQLLNLCESWLVHQGIQKLLVQSSPKAHPFYCHHGYVDMPIDNPYGHKTDTRDIEMGKTIKPLL